MATWQEWSDWLREGYYISYRDQNMVRYYEHVLFRDFARYVYTWPESVPPDETSGPYYPEDLEITMGYDSATGINNIWQMIFGIKGQVYLYVMFPADTKRHGLPKEPWTRTGMREVAHYEEWMSPFKEPSFLTEHFLKRPDLFRIGFEAYNPETVSITPKLNMIIAKLQTERVGTEQGGVLKPTNERFSELLDKLHRRVIPHRPLTLYPVALPAEAPGGV
jgi:hypothetical protein